jgi:hypothetical protein
VTYFCLPFCLSGESIEDFQHICKPFSSSIRAFFPSREAASLAFPPLFASHTQTISPRHTHVTFLERAENALTFSRMMYHIAFSRPSISPLDPHDPFASLATPTHRRVLPVSHSHFPDVQHESTSFQNWCPHPLTQYDISVILSITITIYRILLRKGKDKNV